MASTKVTTVVLLLSSMVLMEWVAGDDLIPARDSSNKRHILAMHRALEQHRESLRHRVTSCTSLERSSPTHVHTAHRAVTRNKRSLPIDNENDPIVDHFHSDGGEKGIHFSVAGEVLKWSKLNGINGGEGGLVEIPAVNFTVETWVKPEGGQDAPVTFMGLYDTCTKRTDIPPHFWTFGIQPADSESPDRKQCYTFRTRSHRSFGDSSVGDIRGYQPNVWTHLAVTYNGAVTKFFVNGAKVEKSESTWGELFPPSINGCLAIWLGGDIKSKKYFRGELKQVRIIGRALHHHEIVRNMNGFVSHPGDVILSDNFKTVDQWETVLHSAPLHRASSFQIDWLKHDIGLTVPPCGQTVCDDPEVVKAYSENRILRPLKSIQYRIINLANDDGSNVLVSSRQVKKQHEVLRKAFKPYNISMRLEQVLVKNSLLRNQKILFSCEANMIGNEICERECQHQLTGNDGGDCDDVYTECDDSKLGNSHCDMECNKKYYNWDGGDCCHSNAAEELTCFDPDSPNRVYMSLDEYKEALGYDNKNYLNIYFADWTLDGLVGLATFPWEHEVHSMIGGIVLKPQQYGITGATHNLIHEVGHILGLWHTHHGVSEMDCGDLCLEIEASLELGDLCSDTSPTNENKQCSDPDLQHYNCAVEKTGRTDFRNYMGYAMDNCTNQFSLQQTARMHCYLDLMHQSWLEDQSPPPVPLAPRIMAKTEESVTLGWVSPLLHGAHDKDLCNTCEEDGSLLQYANTAWSPTSSNKTRHWSAMHATGPPDSTQCEADTNGWMADPDMLLVECEDDCYLDVYFQQPVVAKRLYIWINWNPVESIEDVILYNQVGKEIHLGQVTAFCDMPFTKEITHNMEISRIRIYTTFAYVSIDAVALQTFPRHDICKSCDQVAYRLQRQPAFPGGDYIDLEEKTYTDSTTDGYSSYKYTVSVLYKGSLSTSSPTLLYSYPTSHCGDGHVDLDESCDDGNLKDGDGCSLNCRIENFFHCQGDPSLCYKHSGDGICEPFEERSSVIDCGFYTPVHYKDQWVVKAETNPWLEAYECPVDVVLGSAPVDQKCQIDYDMHASWHPCGSFYTESHYWLKVYFEEAVVAASVIIYLGSDGMTRLSVEPNKMIVTMIGEDNRMHDAMTSEVIVTCRNNPINVKIKQDLTSTFLYTKGVKISFQSSQIAIAAVTLRSYQYLDPRGLETCGNDGHVFNPKTGKCAQYECDIPECDPFHVKYGRAFCTGSQEGDTCKVNCEKGYELSTYEDTVMCVDRQWLGGAHCTPITCPSPQVPHAKVDCSDGHYYGSRCKFECKHIAVKIGTENVIRCEWDGSWTLPGAYCDVKCRKPSVKGGHLVSKECKQPLLSVGTMCDVKCDRGHHFVDLEPDMDGSSAYLKCTESGDWSGPRCERVVCPQPDDVYKGLYSCSHGFYYGSNCTLKCPAQTGVMSTITCGQSGDWDTEFTPCKFAPGTCSALPDPEQYSLSCEGDTIGAKCQVQCNDPEKEAVASIISSIVGKTSFIDVHSITCTGRLVWYPDPLEVHCIRSCDEIYIGDEYCDGDLNRAQCGYDGGDCCESTVPGAVVRPYPPTCTTQCRCVDPDAVENQVKRDNMIRRKKAGRRSNRSREEERNIGV